MKYETASFALDHFGVVAAPTFAALLAQSGDKRKRRSAFNAIAAMCGRFHLLPKEARIKYIGQVTDSNGQTTYTVLYEMPISICNEENLRTKEQLPVTSTCDALLTCGHKRVQQVSFSSNRYLCECGKELTYLEAIANGSEIIPCN